MLTVCARSRTLPAALKPHLIADNYTTRKHLRVERWLAQHRQFQAHFVPTSSLWLNMVERWFREITTKRIRRGSFPSVDALAQAIEAYTAGPNENRRPLVRTADLKDILPRIMHDALDKMQYQ